MKVISLSGEWVLQKDGKGRRIPARVPGDVYSDLLAAGEIPDPFYRDNELNVQWIGETDWSYSKTFTASRDLLARRRILLRCDGLDTFASEFGFQSFPEPKTIAGFTEEGGRNIASRVMEHHQRAPNGNTTLIQQILKCFRMPLRFENALWLSQILQGTAVKNACEHFRRNLVLFAPPKHLELICNPGIQSRVRAVGDGAFTITLESSRVALWTWIEVKGADAGVSDNFFHLRPGIAEQVCIRPSKAMTSRELKNSITIRSLVDTYFK